MALARVVDVRGRTADPIREVLLSATVLAGAAVGFAALVWNVLEPASLSFQVAIWVAHGVWALFVALPVVVRARDGRRRQMALGAVMLGLVASLTGPIVLGPSIDVDRYRDLWWLVNISGHVSALLLVASWGLARRHGAWWLVGLGPALALDMAYPHAMVAAVEVLPESHRGWVLTALPLCALVLGGVACWLIDVLTTRPRPRSTVAVLEHEYA